jgi:putative mRNA 3-end processing factor
VSDARSTNLLEPTPRGLYCPTGRFFIDPWNPEPSDVAVITHAHADHARAGAGVYYTSCSGAEVLRARLPGAEVRPLGWGIQHGRDFGPVRVTLHPAGHVLGSAQVRVESASGEVWVVSGDYKLAPDGVAEPFESVECDVFITESTFGLPIYRWPDPARVMSEIHQWWRDNARDGVTSVLFAYALGKAQRLLAHLDPQVGPILAHGSILTMNEACARAGARLPRVEKADRAAVKAAGGRALVVAPPSADGSAWLKGLGPISRAACSGWMQVRGVRRRGNLDRGFILSDHADWPGLLHAVRASRARRVGVTHGTLGAFVRALREQGVDAFEVPTRFSATGEEAEDP